MTRLPDLKYPSDDYLLALGEAVFNFGLVELGVVHYVDHRVPGFAAASYDMTAVPIMKRFQELATDDPELEKLADAAVDLAIIRNTLLHARPVADPGSEPRLSYAGKEGAHEYHREDIAQFSIACISVAKFFGDWASDVVESGGKLTDEKTFEEEIIKRIEKWKKRSLRNRG